MISQTPITSPQPPNGVRVSSRPLPASYMPLGVAGHDSDSIETTDDLIWPDNLPCAPGPTTPDSPPRSL